MNTLLRRAQAAVAALVGLAAWGSARNAVSCALLVAALGASGALRAGGFEVPELGARAVGRGGACVVGIADLTALHFNPAVLARLDGTRALYHHNLLFHESGFQRAPLDSAWGTLGGTSFPSVQDRESLFAGNAFVAVASDFGLAGWSFAAAVYGPPGVGKQRYPDYGPQSFQMSALDVEIRYYSLAAAWQPLETFAVGLTVQWVDVARLDYTLVTDATSTTGLSPVPDATGTQLLSTLKMRDRVGATAILGLWWRPLPFLEVGFGGRVVPVPLALAGSVVVDKPTLVTEDVTIATDVTLPVQLRAGVRYVHPHPAGGPRFDVEVDVTWENWSVVDRLDLDFEGAISGQPVQDLRIPKAWRDTVSVRLGGDVTLLPDHVAARAGAFWERGAAPASYAHLDFPSFDRFGVGAGLTVAWFGVAVSVGYLHVFQESVATTEPFGKVFQQRPLRPCPGGCDGLSGVVANAGRFHGSFDVLALGVDLDVSSWWE